MSQFAEYESAIIDGKYRVDRRLGQGGMGAVFLATHVWTDRPVALKVILPRHAAVEEFLERFKREARAAGRLRHPNIVDVTDFGVTTHRGGPIAYLVMEYLDGCSLEDVLREDPKLPLGWVVDLFEPLCLAVDEAHRKGIVHRDLKPSNIWLEPNSQGGFTVKVLDFGLAKLDVEPPSRAATAAPEPPEVAARPEPPTLFRPAEPAVEATLPAGAPRAPARVEAAEGSGSAPPPRPGADDGRLTRAGHIMGTPAYMSPEQCRGEDVGPATDIYSLGVILYQALAGALPFQGSAREMLAGHVHEQPAPLGERGAGVPRGVSDVVMAALAKEPERRPASPRLFAAGLRAEAESPAAILQEGVITGIRHLPLFVRLVLLALVPYFVLSGVTYLVTFLAGRGVLGGVATLAAALWASALVVALVAGVLVRGIVALVLGQIALAPMREPRIGLAFRALATYFAPALGAALLIVALVFIPALLGRQALARGAALVSEARLGARAAGAPEAGAAEIGTVLLLAAVAVAAFAFAFWWFCRLLQLPNVIMVEGLRGRAAVDRSIALGRRLPRATYLIAFVSMAMSLANLFLNTYLAEAVEVHSAALAVNVAVWTVLGLAMLATMTFLPVLVGTLYFKLRAASSEQIDDVLDVQYRREEVPSRMWQRRLDVPLYRSSASKRSGASDPPGPAG